MKSLWLILAWVFVYELVFWGKLIRDLILFRFKWSILDNLPEWFKLFLLGKLEGQPRAVDGFHLADGLMVMAPFTFIAYLLNVYRFQYSLFGSYLVPVAIAAAVFWVLFYPIRFNLFYHFFFMKKEYFGQTKKVIVATIRHNGEKDVIEIYTSTGLKIKARILNDDNR